MADDDPGRRDRVHNAYIAVAVLMISTTITVLLASKPTGWGLAAAFIPLVVGIPLAVALLADVHLPGMRPRRNRSIVEVEQLPGNIVTDPDGRKALAEANEPFMPGAQALVTGIATAGKVASSPAKDPDPEPPRTINLHEFVREWERRDYERAVVQQANATPPEPTAPTLPPLSGSRFTVTPASAHRDADAVSGTGSGFLLRVLLRNNGPGTTFSAKVTWVSEGRDFGYVPIHASWVGYTLDDPRDVHIARDDVQGINVAYLQWTGIEHSDAFAHLVKQVRKSSSAESDTLDVGEDRKQVIKDNVQVRLSVSCADADGTIWTDFTFDLSSLVLVPYSGQQAIAAPPPGDDESDPEPEDKRPTIYHPTGHPRGGPLTPAEREYLSMDLEPAADYWPHRAEIDYALDGKRARSVMLFLSRPKERAGGVVYCIVRHGDVEWIHSPAPWPMGAMFQDSGSSQDEFAIEFPNQFRGGLHLMGNIPKGTYSYTWGANLAALLRQPMGRIVAEGTFTV